MKIDTKDSITVNDLIAHLQELNNPKARICFADDGISLKDDLSYDAKRGCYILIDPALEEFSDKINSLEDEIEQLEDEVAKFKEELDACTS